MSYFEPKMLMGDKLRSIYSLTVSAEQKLLFDSLAQNIVSYATTKLINAVKCGLSDMIEVDLSLENISKLYAFNTDIYNVIGVKRAIEKIAEREKLKIYPVTASKIFITF